MGHQETYRHNEAYAEFLANERPHFHDKCADSLCVNRAGARKYLMWVAVWDKSLIV